MKYQTTRDQNISLNFRQMFRESLPLGGGLFVPDHVPVLSTEFLDELAGLDFIGRAEKILALFAPDLSSEEVSRICRQAWPEAIDLDPGEDFIRSQSLNSYLPNPAFCFLTNGRTGSYLDFTQAFLLSCARNLTEEEEFCYLLAGESIASLRALAALGPEDAKLEPLFVIDRKLADNYSMREVQLLWNQALAGGPLHFEHIQEEASATGEKDDLLEEWAGEPAEATPSLLNAEYRLSPESGEIQEGVRIKLPEFTEDFCQNNRLKVYSLKGRPRDLSVFAESFLSDPDLRSDLAQAGKYICHMGSLNFAYYIALLIVLISAYLDLQAKEWLNKDQEFVLAFPNNNLDFLYLSILLKELGLPISCMLLADNSNSCLVDFLRTDRYKKNRKFIRSNTPDLDRLYYPNLERFIFEIVNRDAERSSQAMENLEADKPAGIANILEAFRSVIITGKVSNNQVLDQVSNWYKRSDYLFDPYTALTLDHLQKQRKVRLEKNKVLVISPEHPLLSSGTLASVILGKKNTRKNPFLNVLEDLAEETGLEIPLAACAGPDKPKLIPLDVRESRDYLYHELLEGESGQGQAEDAGEILVEEEILLVEDCLEDSTD